MMQEQANDPGRLWQNRGGQLLKEEKERKVIQKVNIKIIVLLNCTLCFTTFNTLYIIL